jgi:hypothetical protein
MENNNTKKQELKPIPKWVLYGGSAGVVTVGMLVIKGVATAINFTVAHVVSAFLNGDL